MRQLENLKEYEYFAIIFPSVLLFFIIIFYYSILGDKHKIRVRNQNK